MMLEIELHEILQELKDWKDRQDWFRYAEFPLVVSKVLERNKYGKLAFLMNLARKRGDLEYLLRDYMGEFDAHTDTDEQIKISVNYAIGKFDGHDGRVFRDIDWNYDRLYEFIGDKELEEYLREFVWALI